MLETLYKEVGINGTDRTDLTSDTSHFFFSLITVDVLPSG